MIRNHMLGDCDNRHDYHHHIDAKSWMRQDPNANDCNKCGWKVEPHCEPYIETVNAYNNGCIYHKWCYDAQCANTGTSGEL